jgi:serine/threonine protein kinase
MENLEGKTIGGCRIGEKIGQGGMGVVYKAHHLGLDIPVAVKVLTNLSEIPDAQERFLREARIAAKLRHPSIVGVLNVGCEENIHFIVMEYVEGTTLQKIIEKRGKLPPREAVPLAVAVLEALQLAHENGIVHRDVKPENILVEKGGAVKLADLGLARIGGVSNLTQPNTVLGSPYYVAPEQAENPSAADCRADIYSLGCTLYHMVTGKIPFPGNTVIEVVMNHLNKPVPKLAPAVKGITRELSDAVARMMEKNPAKRFKTPRDAISALQNSLADHGTPPAAKRRVRASRVRLIGAIAAVGCIAAVVLFMTVLASGKRTTLNAPSNSKGAVADSSAEITPDSTAAATEAPAPTDTVRKVTSGRKPPQRVVKKTVASPSVPPLTKSQKLVQARRSAADPVLSAVATGDTELLQRLLKEGASLNKTVGSGTTPLHEAVRRGLTRETALLLEYGADVNARDGKGDTPLHYALREGATYMAEQLLKGGADPNRKDHRGKTGLAIAASVDSRLEALVKQYGGK